MIDHLDTLLFRLFRWKVAELSGNSQVRFQPPDDAWRALVPTISDGFGNPANSLNIYLIELRENRKLRTNERDRVTVGFDVYETPAPRRVDCHYLISAWSPVPATPGIDPTIDEHSLLAQAARVVGQFDMLDPIPICAASRPPGLVAIPVPPPLVGETFPLVLMPVEGFPKYAEFWGTMGDASRWKPCIHLVVTVPLKESPQRAGAIVTTILTKSLQASAPASSEMRHHIGGQVLDAGSPRAPVPNAWVELLDSAGAMRWQLTRADNDGRFVFADVFEGDYQVRASSMPLGVSAPRPITVPEPTGEYDVHY